MGAMSQQTKLMILGIIILGIVLLIISDPRNGNMIPAVAILVGTIVAAVLADRSPRFAKLLKQIYGLFFLVIVLLGVSVVITYITRPKLKLDIFLVLFIPILLIFAVSFPIFYLGPILERLGKPQLAEKLYSSMIQLNRDFGFGYYQRALLRHNLGDLDHALQDYDRALEIAKIKAAQPLLQYFSINYSSALIHANKGDVYLYRKHNSHQAILEYNSGLALKENQPIINSLLHTRRGYAQLVNGNYHDALLDFDHLQLKGKMAADLSSLKALAYQGLGRHEEAKAQWKQALAVNPNFANPNWLRDTLLLPESLLKLANQLQTA